MEALLLNPDFQWKGLQENTDNVRTRSVKPNGLLAYENSQKVQEGSLPSRQTQREQLMHSVPIMRHIVHIFSPRSSYSRVLIKILIKSKTHKQQPRTDKTTEIRSRSVVTGGRIWSQCKWGRNLFKG